MLTFTSSWPGVLLVFNEKNVLLNSSSVRNFSAKILETVGRYVSKCLLERYLDI